MADASSSLANAPLVVMRNIDNPKGISAARHLMAGGFTNIRSVTNEINQVPLANLRGHWTNEAGIELVKVIYVQQGNQQELRRTLANSAVVVVVLDFGYYLCEHSSLSLASVWKKSIEEIAAFRTVAEAKDVLAAAATSRKLPLLFLAMVSDCGVGGGEVLEIMQHSAKTYIEDHLLAQHPGLAAKTKMLWQMAEEDEREDEEEEEEEDSDEEDEKDGMPHQSKVEDEVPVITFETGIHASEHDLKWSRDEMARKGFTNPTMRSVPGSGSTNTWDRNHWINYADT